jgi:hypothetical protein
MRDGSVVEFSFYASSRFFNSREEERIKKENHQHYPLDIGLI